MNLQPLQPSASKQDELNMLANFAKLCQPGTYLAELFTEQFLSWCEDRIRSDFTLDIMDKLIATVAEATKFESQLVQVAENLRLAEKRHKQETDRLEAAANYLRNKNAELQEKLDACRSDAEGFLRTAHSNGLIAAGLQTQLDNAQNELVRLKAKLFDLQEKQHEANS